MVECALAAGEYGASDRVYDSLAETYRVWIGASRRAT
jgi:hypothetical protein